MSKLILYIACSLDGYIADKKGGLSFLDDMPPEDFHLVYDDFYASVHTLLMGGKTYRQIASELSPEGWPYAGKKCFVYTKTPFAPVSADIEATALAPAELLAEIRRTRKGDIWLMGGGEIVRMVLSDNLIDKYYIYIMPTLLGDGVPLFPNEFEAASLTLENARKVGGTVELVYSRRHCEQGEQCDGES